MKWIYLGIDKNKEEQFTCVDDTKYPLVKNLVWGISDNGMAKCVHRNNLSYLHKLIMEIPKHTYKQVIHLNGNKLDNRTCNLKIKSEFKERPPEIITSHNEKGWMSRIRFDKKQIYLGTFSSEKEAIAAYVGAWYALRKTNIYSPQQESPTNEEKREAIAYRWMLLNKNHKENIFEIITKNKKPVTNDKGETFESIQDAASFYKKSISSLRNHLNKQTNSCWGTVWKFIHKPESTPTTPEE